MSPFYPLLLPPLLIACAVDHLVHAENAITLIKKLIMPLCGNLYSHKKEYICVYKEKSQDWADDWLVVVVACWFLIHTP